MTFCNTAEDGKYYIRKEEVKPTIYFILFKNHPDGIFKGTDIDERPCKVGFTQIRKQGRIKVVLENTTRKINTCEDYKSEGEGTIKCGFEVIKLPISATSTEAFKKTEKTIREKFGK